METPQSTLRELAAELRRPASDGVLNKLWVADKLAALADALDATPVVTWKLDENALSAAVDALVLEAEYGWCLAGGTATYRRLATDTIEAYFRALDLAPPTETQKP